MPVYRFIDTVYQRPGERTVLFVQGMVGASLLAKIVNDDVGALNQRGVLAFFASRLAPAVMHIP